MLVGIIAAPKVLDLRSEILLSWKSREAVPALRNAPSSHRAVATSIIIGNASTNECTLHRIERK
jgi:hypothetical protein